MRSLSWFIPEYLACACGRVALDTDISLLDTDRPPKKKVPGPSTQALAPEQAPRPGLGPGTYRSSRSHSTGDRPIDRLRGLSQDEEERAESRSCSGRSVSCLPSPLAAVLARPDPRPTTRIDATAMAMNRSEGLAELDGAADGAVAVEVPAQDALPAFRSGLIGQGADTDFTPPIPTNRSRKKAPRLST